MIKSAVPKGWHLKPPPRYGAEPSSLMPHTQNLLIQVIRQCALQKSPSQMLLGQQPAQTAQRKRAWNANCVQTQSVAKAVSLDRHWHRPAKREGAFVWEPPLRGAVL